MSATITAPLPRLVEPASAPLQFPISPLVLDQLSSAWWGHYDSLAIAQLAPLADECCYLPKVYKAPDTPHEVVAAFGYVSLGLKITPGSIIYGFYLPASPITFLPPQYNVQVTDVSLHHEWFDEPVPSALLGNFQPTYLSAQGDFTGSSANLFNCPYPVVGNGMFLVEIWETSGSQQRIELCFGVLEVVS
jgi:hypothetical protein